MKEFYILLCLLLIGIIILKTVLNIQSRSKNPEEKYSEIQLKGISIDLNLKIFAIFIFAIFLTGLYSKNWRIEFPEFMGLVASLSITIIILIDILFQKFYKRDRILINEEEFIYLGHVKKSIKIKTIFKVSLNGLSNKITIEGNQFFSIKIDRFEKTEVEKLFELIKAKKSLEDVEVSENLKEYI